jgi:Secretion system C-terminal sorting domain
MKKYYLLFLLFSISKTSFSQQTFNSTGGAGTAGNFFIDWSIGEMTLIKTEKAEGFTLTQGLLQGKLEVFQTSSTITDGELNILPNPTPGILYLRTGFLQQGKLQMQLYNAAGQLLIQKEEILLGLSTKTINLSAFAGGNYLLKIFFVPTNGETRKRTYKIIKL